MRNAQAVIKSGQEASSAGLGYLSDAINNVQRQIEGTSDRDVYLHLLRSLVSANTASAAEVPTHDIGKGADGPDEKKDEKTECS